MGSLIVKVGNAQRQPLPDQMDVQVVSSRTDAVVQVARNVPGHAEVTFERLADFQPYIVRVFPVRHRPVAQFAIPKPGAPAVVQLYAPLDPALPALPILPAPPRPPTPAERVVEVNTTELSTTSAAMLAPPPVPGVPGSPGHPPAPPPLLPTPP